MTPHEAADEKVRKATEYARASQQLEDLKIIKTDKWLLIREGVKSDKAADRKWDATEEGKQEIRLTFLMKRLEKEISALNSFIRVSENEARQLY